MSTYMSRPAGFVCLSQSGGHVEIRVYIHVYIHVDIYVEIHVDTLEHRRVRNLTQDKDLLGAALLVR